MADIRDVNLNRLAIFVAVVEAGSLTAAAERLGLAKTMVSTHVQRLEAEVGASLVVRTTRRLNVTQAGRAFYDACRDILRATDAALAAVAGDAGPLRGTLRVSAPSITARSSSRQRSSRCATRIRRSTSNCNATTASSISCARTSTSRSGSAGSPIRTIAR